MPELFSAVGAAVVDLRFAHLAVGFRDAFGRVEHVETLCCVLDRPAPHPRLGSSFDGADGCSLVEGAEDSFGGLLPLIVRRREVLSDPLLHVVLADGALNMHFVVVGDKVGDALLASFSSLTLGNKFRPDYLPFACRFSQQDPHVG